jgi:hypothetical protein
MGQVLKLGGLLLLLFPVNFSIRSELHLQVSEKEVRKGSNVHRECKHSASFSPKAGSVISTLGLMMHVLISQSPIAF